MRDFFERPSQKNSTLKGKTLQDFLPGHAFDIMFGSFGQQEFDNFHVVILSGNNKN